MGRYQNFGDLHLKSEAGRFVSDGFAKADFNRDGQVDLNDFLLFAQNWRRSCQPFSWYPWCNYDLDGDLSIGLGDLVLFCEDYLRPRMFGEWVQDDVTSPCIDAGDPDDLKWQNEPWPHGGRINMGAYGGTSQASLSSNPDGNPAEPNEVRLRNTRPACRR